jgi:hypothetical protein
MATVYRVLKDLDNGQIIPAGRLIDDRAWKPDVILKLLEVEAISELHAPPLALLPYFDDEAARLMEVNIVTADQLLTCDVTVVADKLGIGEDVLRGWQAEVVDDLSLPDGPHG